MPDTTAPSPWQQGDAYERYVGRWSRQVAVPFLDWLGAPAGGQWLDVGCGTGALSEAVLAHRAPAALVGVDPSDGFRATAAARLGGRGQWLAGSATAIPLADGWADAVVSGLVLNFVADAPAAVAEIRRVAAPGAHIGAYVWDYAGRMDLMRHFWAAAAELAPDAAALDEGPRFPLCQPDALAALFTAGGLQAVATTAIDVPTPFASFDDYWQPFLGGQGVAPAYAMALSEPARARLRERLQQRVPTRPDGSLDFVARAWAVRGRAPGTQAARA